MTRSIWFLLALSMMSVACTSKVELKQESSHTETITEVVEDGGPARVGKDGVTAAELVIYEEREDLVGFTRGEGGPIVLPAKYSFAYGFDAQSGLCAVIEDNIWWHIDVTGRHVYRAFIYDNGPDYVAEGYARIYGTNDKVGFINADGEIAIPPQFDWASQFEQGYASVCRGCAEEKTEDEHRRMVGGQWGKVDTTGKVTWETKP
jgi:hypothetical protein